MDRSLRHRVYDCMNVWMFYGKCLGVNRYSSQVHMPFLCLGISTELSISQKCFNFKYLHHLEKEYMNIFGKCPWSHLIFVTNTHVIFVSHDIYKALTGEKTIQWSLWYLSQISTRRIWVSEICMGRFLFLNNNHVRSFTPSHPTFISFCFKTI